MIAMDKAYHDFRKGIADSQKALERLRLALGTGQPSPNPVAGSGYAMKASPGKWVSVHGPSGSTSQFDARLLADTLNSLTSKYQVEFFKTNSVSITNSEYEAMLDVVEAATRLVSVHPAGRAHSNYEINLAASLRALQAIAHRSDDTATAIRGLLAIEADLS